MQASPARKHFLTGAAILWLSVAMGVFLIQVRQWAAGATTLAGCLAVLLVLTLLSAASVGLTFSPADVIGVSASGSRLDRGRRLQASTTTTSPSRAHLYRTDIGKVGVLTQPWLPSRSFAPAAQSVRHGASWMKYPPDSYSIA